MLKNLACLAAVSLTPSALACDACVFGTDAPDGEPIQVLVLMHSEGFVHGVVRPRESDGGSVVQDTFEMLDAEHDAFECSYTYDATTITPELLAEYDVLVMYTTGQLPIEGGDQVISDFVEAGGDLLGLHCATDTYADTEHFAPLINGCFDGHPWGSGDTVTIRVPWNEGANPLVSMWAPSTTMPEEIYQFHSHDPEACRVLMSLDMHETERKSERHIPICWVRTQGEGQVFYSSLGHNQAVWESDAYHVHLLNALGWHAGVIDVDTTPNPEYAQAMRALSERAVAE